MVVFPVRVLLIDYSLPLLSEALPEISVWARDAGIDCNDNFNGFFTVKLSEPLSDFHY
jgi:hypothetical protein